jgi:hypothetical protein
MDHVKRRFQMPTWSAGKAKAGSDWPSRTPLKVEILSGPCHGFLDYILGGYDKRK